MIAGQGAWTQPLQRSTAGLGGWSSLQRAEADFSLHLSLPAHHRPSGQQHCGHDDRSCQTEKHPSRQPASQRPQNPPPQLQLQLQFHSWRTPQQQQPTHGDGLCLWLWPKGLRRGTVLARPPCPSRLESERWPFLGGLASSRLTPPTAAAMSCRGY